MKGLSIQKLIKLIAKPIIDQKLVWSNTRCSFITEAMKLSCEGLHHVQISCTRAIGLMSASDHSQPLK